jgi:AcrR family transcriptional regulator
MPSTPRASPEVRRRSAAERREALVEAAAHAFAQTGLHGTAVSTITDAVGITQPYAFSLFGSKKELFLAAVEHCFDRTVRTFRDAAAAAADGEDRLAAMGRAYIDLLADRDVILMQLQAYAACGDDDVREVVRRRYLDVIRVVRELSGAGPDELRGFFKDGMLLNVAAATGLPMLDDDGWVSDWPDAAGGAAAGGGSSPGRAPR